MILLIDNYDSFTWNLVQRIGEHHQREHPVVRRDHATLGPDRLAHEVSALLVLAPRQDQEQSDRPRHDALDHGLTLPRRTEA